MLACNFLASNLKIPSHPKSIAYLKGFFGGGEAEAGGLWGC